MAWLLDTNVLVNAKRDHYGFEFCPGFWDWLDIAWADGRVASIEAVYDEGARHGSCSGGPRSGADRTVLRRATSRGGSLRPAEARAGVGRVGSRGPGPVHR